MAKKKKVPSFLTGLNKKTSKMDNVSGMASFPSFFVDTGSAIVNKLISGKYDRGYPESRMTMIAGPSGAGKSFLAGNGARSAQKADMGVLILDSENALDTMFLSNLDIDLDDPAFDYKGVDSIDQVNAILGEFFKLYRASPKDEQIPFFILIDSLDNLDTSSQKEKAKKGETAHDQGQQVKQLKRMQANIMHQIKDLPIAVVCTKQPYKEQHPQKKLREPYVITEALRFAYSQILLATNRMLKSEKTNKFEGIILEVMATKTRFCKPYQKCVIEVPYEEGMDWYSGILEASVAMGIVEKNYAWYTYKGNKFQIGGFDEYKEEIFQDLLKMEDDILDYEIPEDELDGKQE